VQAALIGIDVGTTNAKAVLFDLAGAELASAECAYGLSSPHPGWAEQDPEEVWRAIIQVLRALAKVKSARPVALAVSSQSGTLIPADANGDPIYPAITWLDGRSEEIVQQWLAQGEAERIRQITGWNPHPGLPLATLTWLSRFNPSLAHSTQRWLCMNDFIVHRLSGQFFTNPSNAGVTQMMDPAMGIWSAELCDLAGVRPNQLSPVVQTGALLGMLRPAVASETSLPPGIPILNGGHDQGCTALALGVMNRSQALLACGTSWVVTSVVGVYSARHVPAELDLNPHVIPCGQTASQSLGGLGAGLEWLVNMCWAELATRDERYRALDMALGATRPGSDGLLFTPLSGGHAAPAGLQQGGWVNLQLGYTRAHLARAVMEGAAFELRLVLDDINRAGMPVNELWMVGGATRSPLWPCLVAEVTGLPVRVTRVANLPAVGAAMLAGWGAGLFGNLAEAQAHFRVASTTINSDPAHVDMYTATFSRYVEALHTLAMKK
jgi:sugar (pentulose or hexulose) kinase